MPPFFVALVLVRGLGELGREEVSESLEFRSCELRLNSNSSERNLSADLMLLVDLILLSSSSLLVLMLALPPNTTTSSSLCDNKHGEYALQ